MNKELHKSEFKEVRSDYFDEASNWWCIDAWYSTNPDEEGICVAHINPDTYVVTYNAEHYKYDELVHNEVVALLHTLICKEMNIIPEI